MARSNTITNAAKRALEAALDAGLTFDAAREAVDDQGHKVSRSTAYRIHIARLARLEREARAADPVPVPPPSEQEQDTADHYRAQLDARVVVSSAGLRPPAEIVAEILERFPGRPPPEAELAAENLTQTIERLRACAVDEVSLFRQLSEQHSRNLGVLLDMVPKPEPDPALDPVNLTMRDAVLHTIRSIVEPTRAKYFPDPDEATT
jgi:hypothetical protein